MNQRRKDMKNKWIQIAASGAGSESRLYALNEDGEIYYITPDKDWEKVPLPREKE